MFLEEQGLQLKSNTIFQDNQSTMKMSTNGRTSCTGNSRHINVRYFFVVDKVKQKEIEIKYCPTELMIADYFTKPLQGKLFHTLRSIIMGSDSIFELMQQYFPIKERIGNQDVSKYEKGSKGHEKEREKENSTEKESGTENRHKKGTKADSENTVAGTERSKVVSWADIVRKNENKNVCAQL